MPSCKACLHLCSNSPAAPVLVHDLLRVQVEALFNMQWKIPTRIPCTFKWEINSFHEMLEHQPCSHGSWPIWPNIQNHVCLPWALDDIRKNSPYPDVQMAVCSVHQASSWIWDCLFSASSNAQLTGGFWKLLHIQCYCRHGLRRCISGDSSCHAVFDV